MLLEHLLTVGYTRVDVVEMPGQVTLRGGIMDVYSPEMDRPVRIDFFGDEIESMRKFDPETQRSSSPVDEITLLPLTETPVKDELLGAVHARLVRGGSAGADLEGGEEPREMGVAGRERLRLSRVGILRSRCGRAQQHSRPDGAEDPRLRGRACHGEEPGRALVEQDRAAA